MSSSGQGRNQGSPATAGWYGRLLTAALFICYLNYVPFHLLNEPHSHDPIATHASFSDAHEDHDPAHEGHSDHHVPHPASEHSFQAAPKSPRLCIALALLPPTFTMLVPPPQWPVEISFCEPDSFLSQPAPEPAQPRAPPLA